MAEEIISEQWTPKASWLASGRSGSRGNKRGAGGSRARSWRRRPGEPLPACGLFWAPGLPVPALRNGGRTDLRLWPWPRDRLTARPRIPFLGEARIRRKLRLELRVRLAWGSGKSRPRWERPGRAGHSGAVRKRLQENRAEESSAERKGQARREEGEGRGRKGETRKARPGKAAPRAGRAQTPRGSGSRKSEAQAGKRGARRPPRPGALFREQPGRSASLGRENEAGRAAETRWAAERSAGLFLPWFRTLVRPGPDPASARDAFLRTRRYGRGAGTGSRHPALASAPPPPSPAGMGLG